MQSNIKSYYSQHKEVFDQNFEMVLQNFNVEAIHKMRTSVKRIRALFILVEYLSGKKFRAKKELKAIRTLFKFGGRIREIQIERQLISKYEERSGKTYPEYMNYLFKREHREISRFLQNIPKNSKRENIIDTAFVFQTVDGIEDKEIQEKAQGYLDNKKKTIRKLINKPASNERIHKNRTHLKQVYYLYDILEILTAKRNLLGLEKTRLREIEQYFGTWHDLVNSPVYLNAFLKTKKAIPKNKYIDLKKQISTDRKKMRQEIVQNLYPQIEV